MNTENGQPSDPFFAEILVNMDDLYEKNQSLEHLNFRIAEIVAEHQFELLEKDNFYTERIKEIEQNSTHQIQTLKKRIQVTKSRNVTWHHALRKESKQQTTIVF